MSSYNNNNNTLTKFGSNIRVLNTPMEQYVTEGEFLQTKEEINTQFDKVAEDISNVTNPSIALKPTVIFSFDQPDDDERLSILEENGFRATLSVQNIEDEALNEIRSLVDRGHDFGYYPTSGRPSVTGTVEEWKTFLSSCIETMKTKNLYNPILYAGVGQAVTMNEVTAAKQVGFKYFRAATVKTTNTDTPDPSWIYPWYGSFKPYYDYVKPWGLGDADAVNTIKGKIDDAITSRKYVVCIFGHKPSYDGYTIEDYRTIVEYVKEKVDAGELQCLTFRQYYDMYRHENDFRQLLVDVDYKIKDEIEEKTSNSVVDFGAKGDGVTDDTQAFINAITALNGKILYVPSGVYRINDCLIEDTPINIIGIDNPTIYLNGGYGIFHFKNQNSIKINGITFKGNRREQGDTDDQHCIWMWDVKNVYIHNCNFIDVSREALTFFGECENIFVCNNTFNYTSALIWFTKNIHVTNVLFDGNFAYNTRTSGFEFDSLESSNDKISSNITISNNHFIDVSLSAIILSHVENVNVIGNYIRGSYTGISFSEGTIENDAISVNNVVVTGNFIS